MIDPRDEDNRPAPKSRQQILLDFYRGKGWDEWRVRQKVGEVLAEERRQAEEAKAAKEQERKQKRTKKQPPQVPQSPKKRQPPHKKR